jgi:hypothetical protein
MVLVIIIQKSTSVCAVEESIGEFLIVETAVIFFAVADFFS